MVDKPIIQKAITRLVSIYGDSNQAKALALIEWLSCQDISESQLNRLMAKVVENCRFMPLIPDLKDLLYGNKDFEAIQAFNIAINSVREYGCQTTMKFSDGRIAQTIAIGWNTLQEFGMDESDLVWKQKKWIEHWKNTTVGKIPATIRGTTQSVYIDCGSNQKQIGSKNEI